MSSLFFFSAFSQGYRRAPEKNPQLFPSAKLSRPFKAFQGSSPQPPDPLSPPDITPPLQTVDVVSPCVGHGGGLEAHGVCAAAVGVIMVIEMDEKNGELNSLSFSLKMLGMMII